MIVFQFYDHSFYVRCLFMTKKRVCCTFLSVMLSILFLMNMSPAVYAAQIVEHGSCGSNVTYQIYDDGLLVISGNGKMKDYVVDRSPFQFSRYAIDRIEIRDGVTHLGYRAFNGINPTSLVIAESVETIANLCFYGLTKLQTITFSGDSRLKEIGQGAFSHCKSLGAVVLPDTLTKIGVDGFDGCSSLQSITLSYNISSIGIRAFSDCDIKDVWFDGSEGEFWNIASNSGVGSDATIHPYCKLKASLSSDEILFGSYPQTRITDASLIAALDGAAKTWTSAQTYSGSGSLSDGKMKPSDAARYADFSYRSVRYRAVAFVFYRPQYTGWTATSENSVQDDNGYTAGKTYYFRYEPIVWRVIDRASGLVVSKNVLDAEAFQNTVWRSIDTYSQSSRLSYQSDSTGITANDFERSSLFAFLSGDLSDTAFSAQQKSKILDMTLLTYDRAKDLAAGVRSASASDYAKCRGVETSGGHSPWWLKTAGADTASARCVTPAGGTGRTVHVANASAGVRPVCVLSGVAEDTQYDEDRLLSKQKHTSGGHTFSQPVWTWSANHSRATAKFACLNNDGETQTITDDAPVCTTPALQMTEDAVYSYTASVVFDGRTYACESFPNESGNGCGHALSPASWGVTDDGSAVTANFICPDCGLVYTVTDSEPVITVEQPENENIEKRSVAAKVFYGEETFTPSFTVWYDPDASVEQPVWSWSKDHSSATATFTSIGSSEEVASVTDPAPKTVTVSELGCLTDHVIKYTAVVEYGGNTYRCETLPVVLEKAVGRHDCGFPDWVWDEDYARAAATFTCSACGKTVCLTDDAPRTSITSTADGRQGVDVIAEVNFEDNTYTSHASHTWQTGDRIRFGAYPQTLVTDQTQIDAMDAARKTWEDYRYLVRNAVQDDLMQYADFFFNGTRYRAVRINDYRPENVEFGSDVTNQINNGYLRARTYYFKYEPIFWRILDPSQGLVVSDMIIDSQPFSHTLIWSYLNCTLRERLTGDFCSAAFTDAQREELRSDVETTISGKPTTITDSVFLLTLNDANNDDYGLRSCYGTDYAKCQGLAGASWLVYYTSPYLIDGDTTTWLFLTGRIRNTTVGMRPALRLSSLKPDISDVCPHRRTELSGVREATCTQAGYTGDIICCDCGKVMAGGETVLLGEHKCDAPKWAWTADNGAATATFRCAVCGTTVTATDPDPIVNIAREATCDSDRVLTLTASVDFNGKTYMNERGVIVADSATGHRYGAPVWTWSEDLSCADATFTCSVCGDVKTVSADGTEFVETPAACETDRETKYTATVSFDGTKYTDEAGVVIYPGTATGHRWSQPFWQWVDETCVKASFTCRSCGRFTVLTAEGDAITREVIVPASADADGLERFTAVVLLDGTRYETVFDKVIPAGETPEAPDTPDDPDTPDAPDDPDTPGGGLCPWDQMDHGTSFWGRLVAFFHRILYFFAHLFGLR